jgi:4-cresol dehydrogenase (hydroxylating)
VAGAEAGLAALERHGFPPFLVTRPMEGGRYHVLRYVACFDRADEEEVGRVRACMAELADIVLAHGYVPYKASADAARRIVEHADPGFVALLTRVRDALDPERRMNPGRWPGT